MLSLLFAILIILIIAVLVLNPKKIKKHNYNSEKILMYGRDSCGYTIKMKELIANSKFKERFQYIDITTELGELQYNKLDVNGVPAFYFKGKIVVGAMALEKLFQKLNI
jgi:glutaredoxin